MEIERNLLISLLKLTRTNQVLAKCVKKDAKISDHIAKNVLKKLQNEGLLYLKGDLVELGTASRLRLAVRAISLGADVEEVSSFLQWQEFEAIAAVALEKNGYFTNTNLRFKYSNHRYEIDVVGCKKPLVLCADCKLWQRGLKYSTTRKIVEAQVARTCALAMTLPSPLLKIECVKWNKAKFIPVILSLIPSNFKFYEKVPVVPILQFQNFLSQLSAYVEYLKYFSKEFHHL